MFTNYSNSNNKQSDLQTTETEHVLMILCCVTLLYIYNFSPELLNFSTPQEKEPEKERNSVFLMYRHNVGLKVGLPLSKRTSWVRIKKLNVSFELRAS